MRALSKFLLVPFVFVLIGSSVLAGTICGQEYGQEFIVLEIAGTTALPLDKTSNSDETLLKAGQLIRFDRPAEDIEDAELWFVSWYHGEEILIKRADVALLSQSLEKVVERYQEPTSFDQHMLFGKVYFRQKEMEQAASHFKAALESDPENVNAKSWLGASYASKDRIDEGLKLLEGAFELAPDNLDVQNIYANVLFEKGELEKATALFKNLTTVNDRDFRPYYNLALCCTEMEDSEGFLNNTLKAIQLEPVDLDMRINLAYYQWHIGDKGEAIELLDGLLKKSPSSSKVLAVRSALYFESGEYEKAFESINAALDFEPNSYYAGKVLVHQLVACPDDKFRNGERGVAKALEMIELHGEKRADLLQLLSIAYAETGEFEKAIETVKRCEQPDVRQQDSQYQNYLIGLFENKQTFKSAMFDQ